MDAFPSARKQPGRRLHRNQFALSDVPVGDYTLKLSAADPLGAASGFSREVAVSVTETSVDVGGPPQPAALSLDPAAPNPFRRSTTLRFTLPKAAPVTLTVYDVLGRHIRTLADGRKAPGEHAVTLDAAGLAPGVYFYRFRTPNATKAGSVVLSR